MFADLTPRHWLLAGLLLVLFVVACSIQLA
jgi:hypothetical protein